MCMQGTGVCDVLVAMLYNRSLGDATVHLPVEACAADDLATVTEQAKACARKWEKMV